MDSYKSFFEGKKVTLAGLGVLGRGVGDARFIAEQGAILTITDLKSEEALASSIEQLKEFPGIKYVLGKHEKSDFETADMVMKAAGIPLDSPYIEAARTASVPVYMSTALFCKFAVEKNARIIGVTGTRGKSTVTQMIYEGLKQAGKSVHLGGNVRGTSTLAMLPDIEDGDDIVLELDSWQLQGFRDFEISPHVAVFTNLMRDHMNYYHDDMKRYYQDKASIFTHQTKDHLLVCGTEIFEQIKKDTPVSKVIVGPALPQDWTLNVSGAHNRQNAAYALAVLNALEIDENISRQMFESYAGLDGRLYKTGERDGVRFYNDSNATTPAATRAALESFDDERIHLIAGGSDKGLDLEEMVEAIKTKTHSVVFLAGSGTEKLMKVFPDILVEQSMHGAFRTISQRIKKGDIVLLSPGFASFGLFRNEYDRSDQFNALVKSYLEHGTVG